MFNKNLEISAGDLVCYLSCGSINGIPDPISICGIGKRVNHALGEPVFCNLFFKKIPKYLHFAEPVLDGPGLLIVSL